MKQGSTLSYLHHDHLGSLVAATDPSGAEVGGAAWARYSPFGQLRLSGGTLPSDRLFTGQTRDNVLGAGVAGNDAYYFFQARYYDATIGQFQSADTALPTLDKGTADPRTLNRYAYANNNPLRLRDSSGHASEVPVEMLPVGPLVNLAAVQQHQSLVNIAPPIHVGPLVFTGGIGIVTPSITVKSDLGLSSLLINVQAARDSLIFAANSKKLRADIGRAQGDSLGPFHVAHHLVPGQLEHHPFVERASQVGWGFDTERNGTSLPNNRQTALEEGLPFQRGSHREYNDTVRQRLDSLEAGAQSSGIPDSAAATQLDHLADNLYFELTKADPGTRLP